MNWANGGECETVDLLYSLIDSIETSAQTNMIDASNIFYVIYVSYKSRHFYKCVNKSQLFLLFPQWSHLNGNCTII
jgi:hypothetical protein